MNTEVQSNIGLSVLVVSDQQDVRQVEIKIREAANTVAPGRCLAILWNPGISLPSSRAIESVAVTTLLGAPNTRDRDRDAAEDLWGLFGTVAIRLMEPGNIRPLGFRSLLILRRAGPKTFERRHTIDESLKQQAVIDVAHKVFTRDVANNTWHFGPNRSEDAIIARLSYLMTWPDEVTAVTGGSSNPVQRAQPDFDEDLVPVPAKRAYYLEPTLLGDDL